MTYLNDCEKSSVVQDNIPVGIVECVAERGLALPHGSELLIVVGFISGAQQAGKDSNQGRQRQRGSECANIRILIIKLKTFAKIYIVGCLSLMQLRGAVRGSPR